MKSETDEVKILYITNRLDGIGKMTEPREYGSVEAATTAPLPSDCTFGYVVSHDGCYVFHSPIWGWQPVSPPLGG
jgi:hypothetical protein